jgi:hypothetical protein
MPPRLPPAVTESRPKPPKLPAWFELPPEPVHSPPEPIPLPPEPVHLPPEPVDALPAPTVVHYVPEPLSLTPPVLPRPNRRRKPEPEPEETDEEMFARLRLERARANKVRKARTRAIILTVIPIVLLFANCVVVPAACQRLKDAEGQSDPDPPTGKAVRPAKR